MVLKTSRKTSRLKPTVIFLAWSAIFAILYAQSPLYLSNQNTYFLHGLAQAGLGNLQADWLANTADPTPVFSGLVFLTYTLTHTGILFYGYYALLMGVYLYSVAGMMELLFRLGRSRAQKIFFYALFLGLHSAALRFALSRFLDADAAFLFEGGLGNQRLLGQVFQPSVFGVFLVLSLYLFLRAKNWCAIPPLALAVYFHPTYLTAAGLMTLAYLWALWRDNRSLRAIFVFGLMTLGAVLPVFLYTLLVFGPTRPEIFQQAQEILIHVRIPHHAIVAQWFNWTSLAQLGLILGGLAVTRKTALFPLYALMSAGAFLLSVLQVMTGNATLALLFPWRISVILVPLGAVSLAAVATQKIFSAFRLAEKAALPLAGTLIGLLMLTGLIRFQVESARQRALPERALMSFVAEHRSAGQVFVTPPKMQNFRLATGAPVFVDFKSNPYRNADVLEWYRRITRVNDFYSHPASCQAAEELLVFAHASRIVLPIEQAPIVCDNLAVFYRDSTFVVFASE